MQGTRRQFIRGAGVAAAAGLAGCSDVTGTIGDGGETYEVGHGDYRTEISSSDFPDDKLYYYCVQSGWMNWASVMENVREKYAFDMNDDQRSSGEALTHMRSNAANPTHSGYNGGYSYGIVAMNEGFTTDYKPANWDKVPDDLKTDNGHMTTTRKMTTAITYRKDVYEERGLDEPEPWEDLKHPDIAKDMHVSGPQAAVGLATALSINKAYGGDLDDVQPVVDYYNEIQEHGAQFQGDRDQLFTSGEISTFAGYDYNALDLKYNIDDVDEEDVGIALLTGPNGESGGINIPYGYGMLKGAPNPEAAKLFMDYVLSLEGQKVFLDAYVRPIRADELDLPEEFPAQSAYDATQFTVDQVELVDKQGRIIDEIGEGAGIAGF
jgi:putative spermidine/putrescine transport system substrate-binding protein